jgi:hypothetical protein
MRSAVSSSASLSLSLPNLKYDKIYLHPEEETHTLPAASKTNRILAQILAEKYTLEPYCDDIPFLIMQVYRCIYP